VETVLRRRVRKLIGKLREKITEVIDGDIKNVARSGFESMPAV